MGEAVREVDAHPRLHPHLRHRPRLRRGQQRRHLVYYFSGKGLFVNDVTEQFLTSPPPSSHILAICL